MSSCRRYRDTPDPLVGVHVVPEIPSEFRGLFWPVRPYREYGRIRVDGNRWSESDKVNYGGNWNSFETLKIYWYRVIIVKDRPKCSNKSHPTLAVAADICGQFLNASYYTLAPNSEEESLFSRFEAQSMAKQFKIYFLDNIILKLKCALDIIDLCCGSAYLAGSQKVLV